LKSAQIIPKIDYIDSYYHKNYQKETKAEKDVTENIGLDHIAVVVSEITPTRKYPVKESSEKVKNNWNILMDNLNSLKHSSYLLPLTSYTGQKLLELPVSEITPASGEVNKKQKLPVMEVAIRKEFDDVRNSLETMIRQVWRDVIGILEIGIYDNFYDLGGDSLKAIQVIAKMKDYGLTLEDMVQYPTIAELAEIASKRHSYIEPEKLPPHLEKNLEIDYFFLKNGSIDPIAKNMDCSTMMFYYNMKRYIPDYADYLLVFFNDISFKLTISPEGVLYNIDVNNFPDITDLYQANIVKGEGYEAIGAIEELLDQGKLPIIKTYTKKLPFHKNFINFNFEVTDTPEDLAKDVHTFVAVAYDPEMLYYVEMPYVLNSNFISYAKNKSVGVIKKDDLKHAFNVEIYYATIDINTEKLNHQIDLGDKIELMVNNSLKPVQYEEDYQVYSSIEALDALMAICRKETMYLNEENPCYNGYTMKRLLDWKLWDIISRRMQLKEILLNIQNKYPNISKCGIIPAIDNAIKAWRDLLGVIYEIFEQKQFLFGIIFLPYLDTIKEAEEILVEKIEFYLEI
ncbi:MAG: hypothetical protein GXY86_09265, partial [Firmicutes bacterium]|nr:hypothetical protein [Bacillota bacterium]